MARSPLAWKAWLVLAIVVMVGWLSWPRDPVVPPASLPDTRPSTAAMPDASPSSRPPRPTRSSSAEPESAHVASLPPEAADTIRMIRRGGPFPHRQDGGVFGNREGHLPRRERGWYREYTVDTPGRSNRGARRIITGGTPPSEWYYTDDHYDSFRRIQVDGGAP